MVFKDKSKQLLFCLKLLIILSVMTGILIQFPVFQKTITVSIDGVEQEFKLKGLYISELTDALNQQYGVDNYRLNDGVKHSTLLADIQALSVSTKKIIKIKAKNEEREFLTFATTMQELIQEVNFAHVLVRPETFGDKVQANLVLEEKVVEENFDVEIIENPELDEGTEHVIQEGQKGVMLELLSIFNTKVTTLGTSVLQEKTKKIIEKGTKHVSAAPPVPSDSVWDKLAFCESGGRWNTNSGNGYYGGIQFSAPTWRTASRAVGLNIAYAHQATREEQIMAATWLQQREVGDSGRVVQVVSVCYGS